MAKNKVSVLSKVASEGKLLNDMPSNEEYVRTPPIIGVDSIIRRPMLGLRSSKQISLEKQVASDSGNHTKEVEHSNTISQLDPILEDELFYVAVDLEVWKREQLLATPLFYTFPDGAINLEADHLKLLHFFLPYATTLEKNLPLLERCFASFFEDQIAIDISETTPQFRRKLYPGVPLNSWCLDTHAPLGGEGFSFLPSVLVKLEIQDRSVIEKYLPGSTNWNLLEQYLCKLFLAKNYDWKIKLVTVDSAMSENWQLDQENTPCYLDINTVLL